MSLFQLKQLWQVTLPPAEEFDGRHLAVGLLDSDTEERIAVGSFSGMLRIYRPSKKYTEKDLLYQTNFNEPIVQIQMGVFLPNIGRSLGVLFLKKLTIVVFAENCLISKAQNINLNVPCFAFLENPLLAASLNSSLLYLNPISKLDIKVGHSIYAINHSQKSNCLYYMDGEQLVMINASIEQWRVVLGECQRIHIYTPNYTDEVVCVGSNCYWIIDDNSTIVETKHIENEISCSMLVEVPNAGSFNILLGTFSQHVLVYNRGKLLWAAKCHAVPISVQTLVVQGKKGFLAMLFEGGGLDVSYLGTQAPVKEAASQSAQAADFQQIEQDIERLEAVMAQKRNPSSNNTTTTKTELKIIVKKAVAGWSSDYVEGRDQLFSVGGKVRVLSIDLSIGTEIGYSEIEATKLTNVKLQFNLPQNLHMVDPTYSLGELRSASTDVRVEVYCFNSKFPYTESFEVAATYLTESTRNKNGEPRLVTALIPIPFSFQSIRSQSKLEKSQHKIVLMASQEIPKVLQKAMQYNEFYREVEGVPSEQQSSITFQLSSNVEVAVVAAKNTAKYRIQSDYYEGICLVLLDFISRCNKLKIELSIESVPLQELFLIAESHHKSRKRLKQLSTKLELCSTEFRQVQKRILARMKDKAGELNGLDLILAESHQNMLMSCNDFEKAEDQLKAINHQLMISIKIVCQLLFLRGKTSEQGRRTIYGILEVRGQPSVQGWGWEEQLIVNSSPLLRKKVTMEELQNLQYERIHKTLLWLVDRTAKGEIS